MERVVDIAGGDKHVCLLFNTNVVRCFLSKDGMTPIEVPALQPKVQGPLSALFSGGSTTCASSSAMDASFCWNRLGEAEWAQGDAADQILISDGSTTMPLWCERDADGIRCWGATDELFSEPCDDGDPSEKVHFMAGAISAEIGRSHVCAVLDDGNVRCFGYNGGDEGVSCGSLAVTHCCAEDMACASVPAACDTCNPCGGLAMNAIALSAWEDVTCVLTTDGFMQTEVCWGPYGGLAVADLEECGMSNGAQLAVFDDGGQPASCVAASEGLNLCCKGMDGAHVVSLDMVTADVERIVGTADGAFVLASHGVVYKVSAPGWTLEPIFPA
ncbi:hypothetical protein [Nannocystis pusilla]|uniref:hypothetical protein n=1 Tax=Nannocystis pusilla TaxID=889268 RepID=UPI003DA58667